MAKKPGKPSPAKKPQAPASKKAKKPTVRAVQAEIVEPHEGPPRLEDQDDSPLVGLEPESGSTEEIFDTDDAALVPVPAKKKTAKSESKSLSTADPITAYLQEVRKYPVLTREQELELAKRYYETKDPKAAQALVTANLRFVVKVAAEYSKFGARLIDLVQEGNMGLMHAVKDFNPYKGVRLITYAVWWIRGYIQEYLMKQYSLVKIGTTHNQKKLFYRLQKEKEALDALGENPTVALIGSRLGIPEEEVQEMALRLKGRDVSLNQPLDEDSKTSLGDFQKSEAQNPDELLAHEEELTLLRQRLKELTPQLNEREKIVLEERLLSDEPLTLQEIGEKYGITREAVRQLEARLMDKIRKGFKDDIS